MHSWQTVRIARSWFFLVPEKRLNGSWVSIETPSDGPHVVMKGNLCWINRHILRETSNVCAKKGLIAKNGNIRISSRENWLPARVSTPGPQVIHGDKCPILWIFISVKLYDIIVYYIHLGLDGVKGDRNEAFRKPLFTGVRGQGSGVRGWEKGTEALRH